MSQHDDAEFQRIARAANMQQQTEELLEKAIQDAFRHPESVEELRVYGSAVLPVPDGRRAIVFALPTGKQIVAPMVDRNAARLAKELTAELDTESTLELPGS